MNIKQKIQICAMTILATVMTTIFLIAPLISRQPLDMEAYYMGMASMIAMIVLWFATFSYYTEE